MGRDSKIAWTDHTFNPWWGCTKVSPGCTNCYAETLDKRTGGDHWGVGKARRRTSASNWSQPLKWNREAEKAGVRPRVFCASMADWLDPEVPVEWLADLLALIAATPNLDWLLLTKRPELWWTRMRDVDALDEGGGRATWLDAWWTHHEPPANVWVGTTVEDQRRADERIPALLSIPARVRFLSCEPLIEEVELQLSVTHDAGYCGGCETCGDRMERVESIDWVIIGGESGPGARPFHLQWARDLLVQLRDADVAVFVKQLGARPIDFGESGIADVRLRLRDSHGADLTEWPADLRVQQFPTVEV